MSSNRKIEIEGAIPLGEGGYGKVFPGKYNGHKVAVKRVDLFQVSDNEEIALLKLDHPNIIKLLHSEDDEFFK
jgi:serine/threonine-protein kinase/endoribonuclease IRE1